MSLHDAAEIDQFLPTHNYTLGEWFATRPKGYK